MTGADTGFAPTGRPVSTRLKTRRVNGVNNEEEKQSKSTRTKTVCAAGPYESRGTAALEYQRRTGAIYHDILARRGEYEFALRQHETKPIGYGRMLSESRQPKGAYPEDGGVRCRIRRGPCRPRRCLTAVRSPTSSASGSGVSRVGASASRRCARQTRPPRPRRRLRASGCTSGAAGTGTGAGVVGAGTAAAR